MQPVFDADQEPRPNALTPRHHHQQQHTAFLPVGEGPSSAQHNTHTSFTPAVMPQRTKASTATHQAGSCSRDDAARPSTHVSLLCMTCFSTGAFFDCAGQPSAPWQCGLCCPFHEAVRICTCRHIHSAVAGHACMGCSVRMHSPPSTSGRCWLAVSYPEVRPFIGHHGRPTASSAALDIGNTQKLFL